jgi:glycosyltransferase involved in cell wall biosynthesis
VNKLAIIIPAYKSQFLELTLQSLVNQVDQRFNVYIGDDNSPDSLEVVAKKYSSLLNLKYVRFDENIGSQSMVKQWERCIALTQNESWLWLIGDDDLIDSTCTDFFYRELEINNSFDLYRFNMKVIDTYGSILYVAPQFPDIESGWDFIKARLNWEQASALCPYIFSKEIYNLQGGFQEFDLGWCSDDASWLKFSGEKGIKTIQGPTVCWRFGKNISADKTLIQKKIIAWVNYADWLVGQTGEGKPSPVELIKMIRKWLIRNLIEQNNIMSFFIMRRKLKENKSIIRFRWLDILNIL